MFHNVHQMKPSLQECIAILARCADGDGNLLLNIGPMPTGEIEPRQVAVLNGIGAWLRKYGRSIYGTRGGPFKPGRYGASTRTGKTIFLHLLDTSGGLFKLPPLPAKILKSSVLTGGTVTVSQTDAGLNVTVTPGNRPSMGTIVKLETGYRYEQASRNARKRISEVVAFPKRNLLRRSSLTFGRGCSKAGRRSG